MKKILLLVLLLSDLGFAQKFPPIPTIPCRRTKINPCTALNTPTPTFTPTVAFTPTFTVTPTAPIGSTNTPTFTPTRTATNTPTRTGTVVVTSTPTYTPTTSSGACNVTDLGNLAYNGGGKFVTGYWDDIAIAGTTLYLRENFGVTLFSLTNPGTPSRQTTFDLEAIYPKTGDGFQTVTKIAVSEDNTRLLVNYKVDHGNILIKLGVPFSNSSISGEFAPLNAQGGIAIIKSGSNYIGLAQKSYLQKADLNTFKAYPIPASQPNSLTNSTLLSTPSGNPGYISYSGAWAVYLTISGQLVVVKDGTSANAILPSGYSGLVSASIKDTGAGANIFVVGVDFSGAYKASLLNTTNGTTVTELNTTALPGLAPSQVSMLVSNNTAYFWSTTGLHRYNGGTSVLKLTQSGTNPKVMRSYISGGSTYLYTGKTTSVGIVKASCAD